MNSRELQDSFEKNKEKFYTLLSEIKKNIPVDIYSVINTTIIANPFETEFPKKFFLHNFNKKHHRNLLFLISSCKYYIKNTYAFFSYIVAFIIYKLVYKQKRVDTKNRMLLDVFFLVDKTNADNCFTENYFSKLYSLLNEKKIEYAFLPRLYGIERKPLKLIKFFRIINKDTRNFIFEFSLITFGQIVSLIPKILKYPFKTLRLLQNNDTDEKELFNRELIKDISKQRLISLTRSVFGENIAKLDNVEKIYSWSEFQVIERSFNYGLRKKNPKISIIACQFYLNYETYFNTSIDDIDEEHRTAFHKVLVNGAYYVKAQKQVQYQTGVSLRYSELFKFKTVMEAKHILVLGSYFLSETQLMLSFCSKLGPILFKSHPTMNVQKLKQSLTNNVKVVKENIYKLFQNTKIVISTASGTCIEAVSCGVSVLVIASGTGLTANPLCDMGKGIVWDIAYSPDEVPDKIEQLIDNRNKNINEIKKIAKWYKNQFFVEPSEKNIMKTFGLEG